MRAVEAQPRLRLHSLHKKEVRSAVGAERSSKSREKPELGTEILGKGTGRCLQEPLLFNSNPVHLIRQHILFKISCYPLPASNKVFGEPSFLRAKRIPSNTSLLVCGKHRPICLPANRLRNLSPNWRHIQNSSPTSVRAPTK